ncbi:MAG: hypothetical protein ACRC1M_05685, partial [Methanobacteriaceae archaeon]
MGYDESLFSREGDGWYSEKANTMATIASEIDVYPGIQLPQRLNGGIYKVASNIKADWADISINNSTTADVQNNQINIRPNESLDMGITHQLVNFDTWYELRLIVNNNTGNLNFVNNGTTLAFNKEGNDYVINLNSFNNKTLNFSIKGSTVSISNIILKCHVTKTGSGLANFDAKTLQGKDLSYFATATDMASANSSITNLTNSKISKTDTIKGAKTTVKTSAVANESWNTETITIPGITTADVSKFKCGASGMIDIFIQVYSVSGNVIT